MQTEIEQILYKYGMPHYGVNTDLDVVRAEFEEVLKFFSLFRPENLFHCIIAARIKQVAKHIDYCALDLLAPFFNSEKYRIYSALVPFLKTIRRDIRKGYSDIRKEFVDL